MGLFQGCSDGFWKTHEELWVGYSPDDIYDDVFGVEFFGLLTLADVLDTGGGGLQALGRQSVGALLNASSPDVNYPFTVDEVIALIQNVDPMDPMAVEELKDLFERFNTLGSPLCEED